MGERSEVGQRVFLEMDCKEIQPVHSAGDQPWDFFGRNDAKAEAPVLWPPHAEIRLIGKDFDAGREWVRYGLKVGCVKALNAVRKQCSCYRI